MKNFFIERGDIVWVEQEMLYIANRKNHLELKSRPFVILSNNTNNKFSTVFNAAPLTTNLTEKIPSHCLITFADKEGRKRINKVLCEQIMSISEEKIISKISSVSKEDLRKIEICVLSQLGIETK